MRHHILSAKVFSAQSLLNCTTRGAILLAVSLSTAVTFQQWEVSAAPPALVPINRVELNALYYACDGTISVNVHDTGDATPASVSSGVVLKALTAADTVFDQESNLSFTSLQTNKVFVSSPIPIRIGAPSGTQGNGILEVDESVVRIYAEYSDPVSAVPITVDSRPVHCGESPTIALGNTHFAKGAASLSLTESGHLMVSNLQSHGDGVTILTNNYGSFGVNLAPLSLVGENSIGVGGRSSDEDGWPNFYGSRPVCDHSIGAILQVGNSWMGGCCKWGLGDLLVEGGQLSYLPIPLSVSQGEESSMDSLAVVDPSTPTVTSVKTFQSLNTDPYYNPWPDQCAEIEFGQTHVFSNWPGAIPSFSMTGNKATLCCKYPEPGPVPFERDPLYYAMKHSYVFRGGNSPGGLQEFEITGEQLIPVVIVPTLSIWGAIVLALLLAASGAAIVDHRWRSKYSGPKVR